MKASKLTFQNLKNDYIQKNWKITNMEIKKYFNLLQKQYNLMKEIELVEPKNNINDQFLLCWMRLNPDKLSVKKEYLIERLEKYLTADVKVGFDGFIYIRFFSPGVMLKIFDLVYQMRKEKVLA